MWTHRGRRRRGETRTDAARRELERLRCERWTRTTPPRNARANANDANANRPNERWRRALWRRRRRRGGHDRRSSSRGEAAATELAAERAARPPRRGRQAMEEDASLRKELAGWRGAALEGARQRRRRRARGKRILWPSVEMLEAQRNRFDALLIRAAEIRNVAQRREDDGAELKDELAQDDASPEGRAGGAESAAARLRSR